VAAARVYGDERVWRKYDGAFEGPNCRRSCQPEIRCLSLCVPPAHPLVCIIIRNMQTYTCVCMDIYKIRRVHSIPVEAQSKVQKSNARMFRRRDVSRVLSSVYSKAISRCIRWDTCSFSGNSEPQSVLSSSCRFTRTYEVLYDSRTFDVNNKLVCAVILEQARACARRKMSRKVNWKLSYSFCARLPLSLLSSLSYITPRVPFILIKVLLCIKKTKIARSIFVFRFICDINVRRQCLALRPE